MKIFLTLACLVVIGIYFLPFALGIDIAMAVDFNNVTNGGTNNTGQVAVNGNDAVLPIVNTDKPTDNANGGGKNSGGTYIITPPIKTFSDLDSIIKWVIKQAAIVAIPIAVLLIIWAGVTYMRSAGDSGEVKRAGQMLLWTAVGLAVIFIGGGFVDLIMSVIKMGN